MSKASVTLSTKICLECLSGCGINNMQWGKGGERHHQRLLYIICSVTICKQHVLMSSILFLWTGFARMLSLLSSSFLLFWREPGFSFIVALWKYTNEKEGINIFYSATIKSGYGRHESPCDANTAALYLDFPKPLYFRHTAPRLAPKFMHHSLQPA